MQSAHTAWDAAEQLDDDRARAAILRNLGEAQRELGNRDAAFAALEQAVEIFRRRAAVLGGQGRHQTTEILDRLQPLPRADPSAAQHAVAPLESRDAGKLARPVRRAAWGNGLGLQPSTAPQADSTPNLYAACKKLPWRDVTEHSSVSVGHGRRVRRTIKVVTAPPWITFVGAAQVAQIRRTTTRAGRKTVEVVYVITSADHRAAPSDVLAGWVQGHWGIENRAHWVRDVDYDEDRSRVRTGNAPQCHGHPTQHRDQPAPTGRRHEHRRQRATSRRPRRTTHHAPDHLMNDFASALGVAARHLLQLWTGNNSAPAIVARVSGRLLRRRPREGNS
jgi:hypothetical protein